ncbi:protein argonaute-3 [Phlebotomus argentipes]|uniref:protein argonaute-3 n=1 Tax=Phlebotomus argentipes TaxID=94469 RepID=UPI0028931B4F|nr:protein argonaute-3 [Phlebotomus argentipes]
MKGRGHQMRLLAEMAKSSGDSQLSGGSAAESPEGQSAAPTVLGVSKDSGEETLESSSLGRGHLKRLTMTMPETPLNPTPVSGESSGSGSRAAGRGQSLRRVLDAARQYDEETSQPLAVVTQKMEAASVQEAAGPKSPVSYRGKSGSLTSAMTNYLPLKWTGNLRIFEYCVQFHPQVDSIHLRVKIIGQLQAEIGSVFVFSGFNLFLPRRLAPVSSFTTTLQATKETITVSMRLIKEKPEEELSPFLNNLFNRVMRELKFVRHKRRQFDPTKAKLVPQHKLEIWPGYITAVETFEGGLMLNLDVSHRRLSTMTVKELMTDIYHRHPQDFHKKVKETIIGKIILTRYNNQTYCVHEIDFNLSPKDKFLRNGEEIDYVEYYRRNYNITINDLNQPLLLNFKEVRMPGQAEKQERVTSLIPELCYLTGLTDEQMNNQNLKRDLVAYTSVTPQHRVEGLRKFLANVRECEPARKVLKDWGLELSADVLNLEGRELGIEQIQFEGYTGSAGEKADFSRDATSRRVLTTLPLVSWAILYVERNKDAAMKFLALVQKNASCLGMDVKNPKQVVVQREQTADLVRQIQETIHAQPDLSIIVIIFPSQRAEWYASVKKVCCYQTPVPSQVIMARNMLQANESKVRSIVMKILLQMNCKIGGTLWSVNIPMANTMICGVDAYHDPTQKSSSVTAFVSSTNRTFTRWFSMSIIQNIKEEVSRGLGRAIKDSLVAFREANGCLPERIVVFRDGVGDGQLPVCENFEVPQLLEAAQTLYPAGQVPKLTYVITQKRINTRFFRCVGNQATSFDNCRPGTVVDHSVTRRYMKDFFLVSQSVRQGTVSPTHYIIVYDSANLSPDIVQKLAYKLTFMYYNWPGTIRVPACCQYAHKLAYLIGEHVKREPARMLQDRLFYL